MARPKPDHENELIRISTKLPRRINEALDAHYEAKAQILAKGALMYLAANPEKEIELD